MRCAQPTPRIRITEVVLIGLLMLMVAVAGAAQLARSEAERLLAACGEQEMVDDRP